jgi:hypothetical protein
MSYGFEAPDQKVELLISNTRFTCFIKNVTKFFGFDMMKPKQDVQRGVAVRCLSLYFNFDLFRRKKYSY